MFIFAIYSGQFLYICMQVIVRGMKLQEAGMVFVFYSFFNFSVTAYEISKVLILGSLVNLKDEEILLRFHKFKSEVNGLKLYLDETEVY